MPTLDLKKKVLTMSRVKIAQVTANREIPQIRR
jgi:hypothetical protein